MVLLILILFDIIHEASFPTPKESGYCIKAFETCKLSIKSVILKLLVLKNYLLNFGLVGSGNKNGGASFKEDSPYVSYSL